MKKLCALAALLMATTTAAYAGNSISFEIEGQKIHIEAPSDCDSLSCIKISAPGLSGSGFGFKSIKSAHSDDDDAPRSDPAPQKSATAPVAPAPATRPAVAAPVSTQPAPSVTAAASPAPAVKTEIAPSAPVATATAAPAQPAAAAPAPVPNTPLGVWNAEENKGMVRIETCGQNLCGYAVKTGEKVLVNMKPQDTKWIGQIHDPDSGKTYDSNIAMKGPNSLRVQGCAFGGMICGGQTWTRVS